MPSIALHVICSKIVSNKLNIHTEDFFRGNILPDIIEKDSHRKIKGSYYLIPDISSFFHEFDLNNDLYLGYVTHLLLDKYFLEEYIPKNIPCYKEINIFSDDLIYREYSKINYYLLNKYTIDISYFNHIFSLDKFSYNFVINLNKYIKNIECLNNKELYDKVGLIDVDTISSFIEGVSDKIVEDIKSMKKTIVFASNNEGKIKEVKEILDDYNITSLKENNIDKDVLEDGNSFYENAFIKAKEIYDICKVPVIADDSGLCINFLDGWPGIYTHRISSDENRNDFLLEKVEGLPDRSAKVVCDMVFYDGKEIISSEGIITGVISRNKRGNNGFGFDSIFELENGLTLAELSAEEKNEISARKKP